MNETFEAHQVAIRFDDGDNKLAEKDILTAINNLCSWWDDDELLCFQLGHIFMLSRLLSSYENSTILNTFVSKNGGGRQRADEASL